MMKRLILPLAITLSLTACGKVVGIGAEIASRTGVITSGQAKSLTTVAKKAEKTFQDITPEQEYYLGRAVGATIVDKYQAQDHPSENRYLNLIGKTLVLSSEKPEEYANYHFLILETDEVNAFAAPSGFIFVSKGMLALCENEDDLAAVLAHEIGHVLHSHALKSIEGSRLTSALTTLATEGAKQTGVYQITSLTRQFEGSIDDMTQTMMNSGYSRSLESEADESAVKILQASGYDANGLLRVLKRMKVKTAGHSKGFAATHPDMDDRISEISSLINAQPTNPLASNRTARFKTRLNFNDNHSNEDDHSHN
ncbi:MAG: M48 family metalloprotease [Methylococcaceae bacterium]|nr:M48 family metalloprotease [Methylococcaceae bacterium]